MSESSGPSTRCSNNVIGRRGHEPWDFKISLSTDEVAAQFLSVPEIVARNEALFMSNLSDADEHKLRRGEDVHLILRSIDREEYYSMNLKKAVWNPNALMLVPWNDGINYDITGTKFFQDFNVGRFLRLGFQWRPGVIDFKVLN